MKVRCADCAAFNLKDSHLAKLGFGLCKIKSISKGHTFSAVYPKDCEEFHPAGPATVTRREKYIGPMDQATKIKKAAA